MLFRSGTTNLASVYNTLAYTNGGTGLTTLGTNGQVIGTNGSSIVWQAGGATTGKAIAVAMIFGI